MITSLRSVPKFNSLATFAKSNLSENYLKMAITVHFIFNGKKRTKICNSRSKLSKRKWNVSNNRSKLSKRKWNVSSSRPKLFKVGSDFSSSRSKLSKRRSKLRQRR